jgi:hypothetical protein
MAELIVLRKLSRERLAESSVLLAANYCDGAKYICGYAVESALKHRIAKSLNWKSYPPENPAQSGNPGFKGLESFRTHDPEILLMLTGKYKEVYSDPGLLAAWNLLKSWNSEIRYEISPKTPTQLQAEVSNMIAAAKQIVRFLGIRL